MNNIIKDSIIYPFKEKIAFLFIMVSLFLGFLTTLVLNIQSSTNYNDGIKIIILIIFCIFSLFFFILTQGYALEILKQSIKNETDELNFSKIVLNSIKILAVDIIYFLIPNIVSLFLASILQFWILPVIGTFTSVIFFLATLMAECRLAKTNRLYSALNIVATMKDINKIGFKRLLSYVLFIFLVAIVAVIIIFVLYSKIPHIVISILCSFIGIYLLFFSKRIIGLLYSGV